MWSRQKWPSDRQQNPFLTAHKTIRQEQLPVKKGFSCQLLGHFSGLHMKMYSFSHHIVHIFRLPFYVRNATAHISGQSEAKTVLPGRKMNFSRFNQNEA